jgi:hypothetical protein
MKKSCFILFLFLFSAGLYSDEFELAYEASLKNLRNYNVDGYKAIAIEHGVILGRDNTIGFHKDKKALYCFTINGSPNGYILVEK